MVDLFFAAGIPFAVYLIFANLESLEEYAYIVFWVFIACLIVFGISVLIKAIFAIKDTVSKSKGKKKCSDERKIAAQNPPQAKT